MTTPSLLAFLSTLTDSAADLKVVPTVNFPGKQS